EAGDIVSNVMSFGSATPVEVAVHGPSLPDNLAFAARVRAELEKIPSLRDLAYDQALAYPALEVVVDPQKAGYAGVTSSEVGHPLAPATLSSRFVTPNYWRDPKSGVGYQVQVEVEAPVIASARDVEQLPIKQTEAGEVRLEDVARVKKGTRPG